MDFVGLGLIEDDTLDEDELWIHEDGNFLTWDDGMLGGEQPVWLSPFKDLDEMNKMIECNICKEPKSFLFQIYAPIETMPQAFHRSLYGFVCRNPSCNCNFTILRTQLEKVNDFYVEECENDEEYIPCKFEHSEIAKLKLGKPFPRKVIVTCREPNPNAKRCNFCQGEATAHCQACKCVYYCSRDHQKADWKDHREICKMLKEALEEEEEDEATNTKDENNDTNTTDDSIEDNNNNSNDVENEKSDLEVSQADFHNMIAGGNEEIKEKLKETRDPYFISFQKRMSLEPTQALRYCCWPEILPKQTQLSDDDSENNTADVDDQGVRKPYVGPLWISGKNQCAKADVPNCPHCNAPRKFELQLLPTTLYYLNDTEMDFGTIVIYTCSKSCKLSNPNDYTTEYAFVQLYEK